MNEKIWKNAIIVGIILMSTTMVVNASELSVIDPGALENVQSKEYQYQYELSNEVVSEKAYRNRYRLAENDAAPTAQPKARFKGIWGDLGDNETKGYVQGIVGKRGRVGFLKGTYNTTDGNASGRVFGILKKGYFNGKVVTPKGGKKPITGFYRIDRENHSIHIQWMTPNRVGWAHLRVGPINTNYVESID